MPEVVIRKRKRPKKLGARIEKWVYQYRPQIVVVCAFVIAGLLGAFAVNVSLHAMEAQAGAAAGSN